MARFFFLVERLILIAVGLYMILLTRYPEYTLFLNPRFRWLTLTSGVGLCLLGMASFRYVASKLDVLRTGSFLLFFALVFSYGGFPFSISEKPAEADPGENEDSAATIAFNNTVYRKINTAELFYLLQKGTSENIKEGFVVRGIVKRTPELEGMGRFALLRVNMVCCIADAMAMGVIVSTPDADHLPDGEWVRVFGRVEPLPSELKLKEPPTLDKIPYTMVFAKAVLVADTVEKASPPEAPYMFEVPGDTEYHY